MFVTYSNQEILSAIIRYSNQPSERHFEQLYKLINQHPKLNRNQCNRYRREIFEEAVQEAWLIFYRKNLKTLLKKLEVKGTPITLENATAIVTRIIKHLNVLIHNKNVDLWRRETFPKAS